MSYCTVDDVIHEFHPTLKLEMERHYGDEFEANIEKHIEKAEAFVNSSLARAYSIPLKKATTVVISAECKIAAYFAGVAFSEKDEILLDKYETAKEMLDNLVEADKSALVDEGLTGKEKSGVRYSSDPRIFTQEKLAEW